MIEVTQFMRPNGRQVIREINEAPELTDMLANECIKAGARFTMEVLMNGEVSFACEYKQDGEEESTDIAIEICENAPGTMPAFEKLVNDSFKIVAADITKRESNK